MNLASARLGRPDFHVLRKFLRVMDIRVSYYALPIALRIAIAALDAAAMWLLIPLGRGLATNDLGFVWAWPGFAVLRRTLPADSWLVASPNRGAFITLVAMILLASVASAGLGYVVAIVCAYRNGQYAARVRAHTLERYLSFGKLYFDRNAQGDVHAALGHSHVVVRILELIEQAIHSCLALSAQLAVMVVISWRLTLLMLLVVPVMRYMDRWIVGRIAAATARLTADELALGRRTFNILSCLALVKSYRFEAPTHRRYQEAVEGLRQRTFARERFAAVAAPLQQTVMLSTLLIVVLAAVAFTRTDATAELGAICAFLLIARRTFPMLWFVTDLRVGLAGVWSPLAQLTALFDDHDKFFVGDGARGFRGLTEGIEFRNHAFAYADGAPVLSGLSCFIPAGRTVAIVGETGCGKTTMLSLIARLYDGPPGSLLVDGVDIRDYSLSSLLPRLALVSQDPWLFNDTLRNNLVVGLNREVGADEMAAVLTRACLEDVVRRLPHGLETEIGDRGVRLSGGEQQRVSIARALLRGADVLLLDEATAALDTMTERKVQRALEESGHGRTVIVVAHRLSTVRHADKILVIDKGRLIEEGTWAELMAKGGAFFSLWQAQTRSPNQRAHVRWTTR